MASTVTRGTTPTLILNVKDKTLKGSAIFVTIKHYDVEITKKSTKGEVTLEEKEDYTQLFVNLTQKDTLKFHNEDDEASVQVRWIDSNGKARATRTKTFSVDAILLEGEIEYEQP